MSGTNVVSLCFKSARMVISSRLLCFHNKSFTALKPHSAIYEDGKGNSHFLAKLVECVYLDCVSSQKHAVTPFLLNTVLIDTTLCISESSSW